MAAPAFVILWSSAFIAGSYGLRSAPPLLLTLVRLAAAGVILALVAWATRAPWPRGRQLLHVVVAGLLLQAVQFGGFYWALALGLPAALTALVQGLTGQALGWLTIAGLVVSGAGVILASRGGQGVAAGSVSRDQAEVPPRSPTAAGTARLPLSREAR
jgi:drug/metabolite transporter (DMT)-like permease